MSENCFSRIASTGSFLPKRAVSNEELAQDLAKIGVETSDEWIRTRTGIGCRHIASEGQTTLSLAVDATRDALTRGNIDPQTIDLIIVATTTPDGLFPSMACKMPWASRVVRLLTFRRYVPVLSTP